MLICEYNSYLFGSEVKNVKIKQLRKNKKLSQEQLANILSVERSTVAKWETGKALPRTDKLTEIAKALDCTVADLLAEPGEE